MTLLRAIEPSMTKNQQITGFCTHELSKMVIRLGPVDDISSLYVKQYPVPQSLIKAATKILARYFRERKMELGNQASIYNCPIRLAPKRDEFGQLRNVRFCTDMRHLNKVALKLVNFAIPRVDEMLRAMAGSTIFAELDLSEAYAQCELTIESRQYTTFRWMGVAYQSRVLPFGFRDAPEMFQRLVTTMFSDMLHLLFPYFDNLIVHSRSFEEHQETILRVIKRLNDNNMKIKPGSLKPCYPMITVLGRQISAEGVGMDPAKIEVLSKWEKPKDGSNLRAFLGFIGFIADHIRHFAEIAAPLYAVKTKNGPVEWTEQMEENFELLKDAAMRAPVLVHADFSKHFMIICDASNVGVGSVLYQVDDEDKDDTLRPDNMIAIHSKKLSATQSRYSPFKKEVFAMTIAMKRYHTYIYGRTFTLVTDHKPIVYLKEKPDFPVSIQCWTDILLNYNYTVKHRPGVLNVKADALSRMYRNCYEGSAVWGIANTMKIVEAVKRLPLTNVTPTDEFEKTWLLSEAEAKKWKQKDESDEITATTSDSEMTLQQVQDDSINHDPCVAAIEYEMIDERLLPVVDEQIRDHSDVQVGTKQIMRIKHEQVRLLKAQSALMREERERSNELDYRQRLMDGAAKTRSTEHRFGTERTYERAEDASVTKAELKSIARQFHVPIESLMTTKNADERFVLLAARREVNAIRKRRAKRRKRRERLDAIREEQKERPKLSQQVEQPVDDPMDVDEDQDESLNANAEAPRFIIPVDKMYDPTSENEDDRLRILLERRGLKTVEQSKREAMIQGEHALGHFGRDAIYNALVRRRHVWWPKMRKEIELIIERCDKCLAYTATKGRWHPALSLHTSYPGQHYQMDLMELPRSRQDCETLLVLIDLFTGFVMLKPVWRDDAKHIAELLLEIFSIIGPGKVLESDNDSKFISDVLRAFNELIGVNQRFITPYHPQSNGRVERAIQTVRHTIRKLLEGSSADWPLAVPFVQLTINRKINRRTGVSPFELMYGREMNGFQDFTNDKLTAIEDMSIDEWRDYQNKLISVIYPACSARSSEEEDRYKKMLDRTRRFLLENKLPNNTLVLLKDPLYVKDTTIKPKFVSMYLPSKYRIIGCTENGAYTVINVDTNEVLDRKVTIDQMRRISGIVDDRNLTIDDDETKRSPKDESEDDEFELEKVLSERWKGDRLQYLLKWKGYERPSWEWKTNVHAPRLMRQYQRARKEGRLEPIDENEKYDSPSEEDDDEDAVAIANIKEDDDDDEQQAIIRWQQRDRPALLRRIDEQIAESERV